MWWIVGIDDLQCFTSGTWIIICEKLEFKICWKFEFPEITLRKPTVSFLVLIVCQTTECVISIIKSSVCQKSRVCHFLCQEHVKQRSVSFLASRVCQKSVSFVAWRVCYFIPRVYGVWSHTLLIMVNKACMYILQTALWRYIHYSQEKRLNISS